MHEVRPAIVAVLAAALALSACSKQGGPMMHIRATGAGPDEFAIVPTKPLEAPKDYNALPEPDTTAGNLADPNPRGDAAAALGGRDGGGLKGRIPRGDQGIVAFASRYGVTAEVRAVLAREDARFRSKHRGKLLERMFGTTVYFSAYKRQTLDRFAELKRLRRVGIKTPAAPPQSAK